MTVFHQRAPLGIQVEAAINRLNAVKRSAVPAATARSLNTVGRLSERQTAKDVAKQEKIIQRAVRSRIQPLQKAKTADPRRRVKLRCHPMPAAVIGKPRQTRRGVTVRQRKFPGAFVADGGKGYGKYIQARSRSRKQVAYYPTSLSRQQVLQREGRGRYPLSVVTVPIEQPLATSYETNVRRAYNQSLGPELAKHLARELTKITRR